MTLEALCAASSDVLVYDTFNAAAACAASAGGSFLFGNAPAAAEPLPTPVAQAPEAEGENSRVQQGRIRKRRRRQRSVKNAETQRMTHIAVERNRRRQMNEYLAVLRTLMPESCVHRSDQASIVSGAIDFVKELEQQLQTLEAQKLALQQQQRRGDMAAAEHAAARTPAHDPAPATEDVAAAARREEEAAAQPPPPPFARFFRYPQYAWRHVPPPREDSGGAAAFAGVEDASSASAVADVEVGLVVDAHATLRAMAPRRPGQLVKMVAGMQALGLAVLHLNVTAAPGDLALYTLNLKVEEGCGLTTAEDIAAAAHHVFCIIDAEATAHLAAGHLAAAAARR